jgi:hypothetical protein
MGGVEMYIWIWRGHLREREQLEGPDVDRRITLRWVFRK